MYTASFERGNAVAGRTHICKRPFHLFTPTLPIWAIETVTVEQNSSNQAFGSHSGASHAYGRLHSLIPKFGSGVLLDAHRGYTEPQRKWSRSGMGLRTALASGKSDTRAS